MKLRVALSYVKLRKIQSCALDFSLMVCCFCCWKCLNPYNTNVCFQSPRAYAEACDPLGLYPPTASEPCRDKAGGRGRPGCRRAAPWTHAEAWLKPWGLAKTHPLQVFHAQAFVPIDLPYAHTQAMEIFDPSWEPKDLFPLFLSSTGWSSGTSKNPMCTYPPKLALSLEMRCY